MADLVLSVDVTSLADARKKLDGFQKAMNGLSVNQLASGVANLQGKIKQLVEAQAKGNIGASAYNKGLLELKRAYEQLGYSSQQATAAVRQYAAQLQRDRAAQQAAQAAEELARAQAQVAARTRELRLRFQEGYAAFDRARKQMRDLREAMRQGVITTDQYKEAVRRLREEQQRAGAAAGGLGRNVNRTGVITQQAGYQIGDFIVQVQSGTNAFVAFGQQATQVAGTLTLLGGKWILIGSVLGVAIPLLTALGAAYMRTNGAGQTLDQTLSKLKESFSELSENMGLVGDAELDFRFGNLTTEIRNLASAMVELNATSELTNLTNALDAIENQTKAKWWEQLLNAAISPLPLIGGTGVNETNEQAFNRLGLPMGRQDLVGEGGFLARMQEAAGGGDREGVVRTFQEMVGLIRQAEGGLAGVSQEGRNLIAEMYKINLSTAETNALLNGSAEAAREAAEAERERLRAQEEAQRQAERTAQFLAEQEALIADQTLLYLEIAKYGENSLQVERERAFQARVAYQNELMRQKVGIELIPTLMEQYDAMVKAREESEKTTRNVEAMSRVGTDSIVAQVNNLAVALNTTAENAARAVGGVRMLAMLQAEGGSGRGQGPSGAMPPRPGQFVVTPEIEAAYQEYLKSLRGGTEGGAGGGADPLAQLRERLALEKELLGKSEAQQRVIQALGINWRSYGEETVNSLVASIEEMDRFNERVKQQQQLADSIANSFGDAFMSIVDGTKSTKDAFKDMARAIIADLYQMFVVKQITGFIGNAIMGAMGGGGPTRPVMRPTPQAAGGYQMPGRPYLVGEHGPELVIPGRSSTVTNADLTRKSMGGSDAVVVNNNINVTGGTDPAAIRQEVAKLMPAITNATKTAVIDARRRGGQMKAAFQ